MRSFSTAILLFFFSFGFAQTTIKSRIITAKEKEALGFADVFAKNTQVHALSNLNGWFNLQCNNTDTIIVSCLGYQTVSLRATDAMVKNIIEMIEDTIKLGEITILAESAYKMLLRARDSTNTHFSKSIQGTCLRKDRLSLNNQIVKNVDSEIIFKTNNIKNRHLDIDYWLNMIKTESKNDVSDQPHLVGYPNTIPFNRFGLRMPKKEELSKFKCTIASGSDDNIVIKVIRDKPTVNMLTEFIYLVNKKTWVFEGIESSGNFEKEPLKKSSRYFFFQSYAKLKYTSYGDSCILKNFIYKLVFSYKKNDPENLWEYFMNMDIIPTQNAISMPDDKKLRPLDFLLYKDKKKN